MNNWHQTQTKEEIAKEITTLLGVKPIPFSTGSTEPRELFICAAEILGIPILKVDTKITLAKKLVEAGGQRWMPNYESTGSTVTKSGLLAVLQSLQILMD